MKKLFFVFLILIFISISAFLHLDAKKFNSNLSREIVLAFITYNGYGNNLYIDNVLTGQQPNFDVTVTSVLNIPYDTTYSTLTVGNDTISPVLSVSNIGRNSVTDTVTVFLRIVPGSYIDSAKIFPLNSGQTAIPRFKTFMLRIGTGYFLKAYTSYSLDSNMVNDTLNQYSIRLPGYKRNVLFEEFTSNSSPSAANNNPQLNFFINSNIQNITAIKYHTGILGIDSFYFSNTSQVDARSRYYFISSIPTTIADGKLFVSIPYGDSVNLYNPYLTRLSAGTPVSMNVIDERVSGDSIKTTISLNIISHVPPGNYKLRINAVERYVYDTLQGTNGETQFYDVFRQAYPDTNGISIPTTTGSYQYQYTYYKNSDWVDSMIYTAAFIQNDNTREVTNSAKGRNIVMNNVKRSPKLGYKKSDVAVNLFANKPEVVIGVDSVQTSLNVELFEAYFPPLGWKVFNQDGFITFGQFTGANGPTIGGARTVIMDFFDYNIPGQKDSMYSKVYSGLLSSDSIRFDYAYAQYNSLNIDSLIVKISTDGGLTFPTEIFRKGGLPLATAPQTTSFFIPSNNTQWRRFSYPLSDIVSINTSLHNIPQSFQLNQNYPNPFNPNTIISYELPLNIHVKLVIYDILGKEIITLVNEKQNAGVYEVVFDALHGQGVNLSSGIYYYQILTDNFSDTKRMAFIK